MKSKFLIIFFLLIFASNFFYSASSDEFNFDVTELQITEKGNIIKGINGGIVTTQNDQIVITADNFRYNKLTTLLEAEGNVRLVDKIEDIIIESNEIFYLKSKEEIYTKGISKALNGANIQIDADKYFKYNKLTTLLEAKGNVKLNDRSKDIIIYTNEIIYLKNEEKISTFGKTNINIEDKYNMLGYDLTLLRNEMLLSSNKKANITDNDSNVYKLDQFEYLIDQEILKGKKIEVTTKNNKEKSDKYFFETGFFNLKENTFLGKDINVKFHKKLFNDIQNDPRIIAVSGYGNEFKKNFDKGVFTSCKKTDKCPPWAMKASKIQHDAVKKQITYTNAWLEIYDFPVAYFPKFFHPDPSVTRQSGLLRPAVGDHNTLGDSIYLPYFFVISDDRDITIKPRLFNNNTFVLQNEYRQITKNSLTIIDSSITRGHDSTKNDKNDTRSHFFANSKIDLDLKKFIKSNLEINIEKSSNDNYLKLFDFITSPLLFDQNRSSLESLIKLDLEHENYDLTTSFEVYETLNGSSNADRYQYVLPSYNLSKNFTLENLGGSFNFNSLGNNTLNNTNVTTSALTNNLNYKSLDSFLDNGIKKNFEILLKNINSMGKNSTIYKNSPQSELMSAYNYNLSLPLVKNKKNSINRLIPKISFKLSPHEMKDNGSNSRRINVDNVFSSDRLSLGNSFEAGESLTLGIDFIKEKVNINDEITEITKYFDFKLATVLKLTEEKNIPITSTLNKKTSNIFGQINFEPNENISLGYDFSLTNDLNTFEYNSLDAKFNYNNFSSRFDYIEERGVIGKIHVIENTTEYNFDEFNSISFSTRRNRELNLTEYYDLIYEYKNDCLIADVKYRKDYYKSGDIKPKEELFFSITIIPFYTYSPDKMILNKDRVD
ncbi:organic solvent tolerance protein [Candidatus Pelagibacter sp. Uisw_136]|uniref:organic solvent tolerance protein n=1 Tax=Candidatus Pelagibacter sp. Uisw_136 TaxID=3230991 RepID=UPI0039EAAAB4